MAEEKKSVATTDKMAEGVSYLTFESEMTRMERTNHRLWILCILMLTTLIGTNGAWLWYESTFEEIVLTQEAQTETGKISLNGVGSGTINYYDEEQAEETPAVSE